MKLSDKECKAFKPKDKPYKKADGFGMYLEIMPNGSKYWRLKYRYNGKEKRLALGVYPDVSLKEAREKRDEARKNLAADIDPSFAKQSEKRQARIDGANTYEAIAREWIAHNAENWTERHKQTVTSRLERDVFQHIGHMPIKDITAPILLDVIRMIEKRGAYDIARRALQTSGQVFRYAIVTGRAERDVSADLKGALRPYKKGHYSAMEVDELPKFLSILHTNDARLFPQTKLAIELMLLTFVRTGELINAKWAEFDLERRQWIIPAERMKLKRDHLVPLSEQAMNIIQRLHDMNGHRDHVFPSQRNPRNSMSNNTILYALGRMGYKGQHTGHGFRALARTAIRERLNYDSEIIEKQLAHKTKETLGEAYDRTQFIEQRVEMMQSWADYIDEVSGQREVIKARFG